MITREFANSAVFSWPKEAATTFKAPVEDLEWVLAQGVSNEVTDVISRDPRVSRMSVLEWSFCDSQLQFPPQNIVRLVKGAYEESQSPDQISKILKLLTRALFFG